MLYENPKVYFVIFIIRHAVLFVNTDNASEIYMAMLEDFVGLFGFGIVVCDIHIAPVECEFILVF